MYELNKPSDKQKTKKIIGYMSLATLSTITITFSLLEHSPFIG